MSLPVTQPFDYPDWGAPGVLTAANHNFPEITFSGEEFFDLDTGYYNHTMFVFDGNGDASSYTLLLKWYTANPTEGGSVQITQQITVAAGCIVVVPVTNPTTYMRIQDVASTAYPHNVLMTVAQFAQWGSMVGYPGGETVLFILGGTSGVETLVWAGAGCAPGRHEVRINTDNPSWTLYLRDWYDCNNSVDMIIASSDDDAPWVFDWIAPANSWQLVYFTDSVGDYGLNVIVTRLPT